MRTQTQEYLKTFLDKHPEIINCLDVGSMEAGGGSIRQLFEGRYYLGVDMRKGDNVDLILNAHELETKLEPETFDLVTCFDTFEHDDAFWITLEQMRKVLKKGGWMMIGVPSRFCPEHDHPHDYWRFMPQCMNLFFESFEHLEIKVDRDNPNNFADDEIYGWGQKS